MSELAIMFCKAIAKPIIFFASKLAPITRYFSKINHEISRTFEKVKYTNQLIPFKDEVGDWCFETDKNFKILQIADIHLGGGFFSRKRDKKAMNAVASMVTAEKPDLVVFTGDVVFSLFSTSGTFNNKTGAEMFINMMEGLGCYWAMCFGNHEFENYCVHDEKEVVSWYTDKNLKYCLFDDGPEGVDGHGNQVIKIKNSNGAVVQALFFLDSHTYVKEDYFGLFRWYDNIHVNQIQWYKDKLLAVDAENKLISPKASMIKSILFHHIPQEEFEYAWSEYRENGYKDTENVKYFFGQCREDNEKNSIPKYKSRIFETLCELKSTQAVFVGHNHLNNFSVEYKGIRLTYGMSIDYLAYYGISRWKEQRGCTIIKIRPDGSFDCRQESYYQDKYVSRFEKEIL